MTKELTINSIRINSFQKEFYTFSDSEEVRNDIDNKIKDFQSKYLVKEIRDTTHGYGKVIDYYAGHIIYDNWSNGESNVKMEIKLDKDIINIVSLLVLNKLNDFCLDQLTDLQKSISVKIEEIQESKPSFLKKLLSINND